MRNSTDPLLTVSGLDIRFPSPAGGIRAASGVSFTLREGEILGLVGESGSGKSVTAHALTGLLPAAAKVFGGSVRFDGQELLALPEKKLRALRGKEISMIFQDPMSCLDPVFRVENLLTEVLCSHNRGLPRREAASRGVEMLRSLGIRNAESVMRSYPGALSGGMRQRVMIAAALLCEPRLLIADEPTTALDVTTQEQILALLRERQKQSGMAVLFITHDLGVVAELCGSVCVMYGGRILERGTVQELFSRPAHPYTRALMAAIPRLEKDAPLPKAMEGQPASPAALTDGYVFHPRCAECTARCRNEAPAEVRLSETHSVCCHLYEKGARP